MRTRRHKFFVLYANLKQNAQSDRIRPERRTLPFRLWQPAFRLDFLIAAYSAFTVSPRPLNLPVRHHELYLHSDECHRLLSYVLVRLRATSFFSVEVSNF